MPAAKPSLFKVIYSSYKRCRWQQLLLTFCYEALYFSLDQIKQHPILSAAGAESGDNRRVRNSIFALRIFLSGIRFSNCDIKSALKSKRRLNLVVGGVGI